MIKHLIKLDFYAMKPLKKVILPFLLVPIVLGVVADLGMSIMVTLTFMVFTIKFNLLVLFGSEEVLFPMFQCGVRKDDYHSHKNILNSPLL